MERYFTNHTWLKIAVVLLVTSAPVSSTWAISLFTGGGVAHGPGNSCSDTDTGTPASASCDGPDGGTWSGNASATSFGLLANSTGAPDNTKISGQSIMSDTFTVNTPGITDPGTLVFTYDVSGSVSSNAELGARLYFQTSGGTSSGTNTNCVGFFEPTCYQFGTGAGEYLGGFFETVSFMFPYVPDSDFFASITMALNIDDQTGGVLPGTVADFLNSAERISVEALVNDISVAFSLLDSSGAEVASGDGNGGGNGGDPGGNIPEPSTVLLMGLGLAGLGAMRRRMTRACEARSGNT